MTLLAPGYLAVLGLAIPILLLYMLKLRRRELKISSLHLWQKVIRDREANIPWQRVRRNLLLLLQLLFLALISLALARPSIPTAALATGSLIVLLDGSASMQAQDIKPDRFSVAKDAVRRLILDLEPDGTMTLILVNDHPEVLAAGENDSSYLLEVLDGSTAADTIADWQTAAALAAGAAQNLGDQTTTVFLTDGGTGAEPLPPIQGEVRYLPIATSGENLAVSQLAVEIGDGSAQLFAQITNYGTLERSIVASVYRDRDLIHARSMVIPGGQDRSLILEDLTIDPALFEVQVVPETGDGAPEDHLLLDNRAFFPLRAEQPKQGLLVTDGNYFLEQLLGAFPNITFLRALGEDNQNQDYALSEFDLFVFDGQIPNTLPNGNILLINPPPNELFPVSGEYFSVDKPIRITESELSDHLVWEDVHIRVAQRIDLPIWGEPLVSVGDFPLVFTGETEERRIAVITFDLFDSDLPLSTTYPILMANLIDYLTPTDPLGLPETLPPGESLSRLLKPAFEDTTVTTPSQEEVHVLTGSSALDQLTLSELGVYSIQTRVDNLNYVEYIAVNLHAPMESRIAPAGSLRIGTATALPQPASVAGKREFWPLLVLIGLVILLAEWWVSQQGRIVDLKPGRGPLFQEFNRVLVSIRSRIGIRRRLRK